MLSYLQLAVDNIETWETFEAQYGTAEERASGYVKLHSLLRPYIIRRMKKDVEKSLPPKVRLIEWETGNGNHGIICNNGLAVTATMLRVFRLQK